ncbi:Metal homeostatis protein BSD2 [Smittium culicis]|uniref:Metal homeostatis protein BSD2 n=1 Tax=Smittium culicis TaxID=133412 RepID=A0A1R1YMN1_9FUNG|nr:Metal homeostatis protein BSD2 [Smittium culicis]
MVRKKNYKKIKNQDSSDQQQQQQDSNETSQLATQLEDDLPSNKLEFDEQDLSSKKLSHQTPNNSTYKSTLNGMKNDGVFKNLSVKPESTSLNDQSPPLPTYDDIFGSNTSNPFFNSESTMECIDDSSNSLNVDGMPVGSALHFILNFVIALVFHIIGFLLTYFLHSTHASLSGSLAGFGTAMINFGVYIILFRNNTFEPSTSKPNNSEISSSLSPFEGYTFNPNNPASDDGLIFNNFVATILIVSGVLFVLKAVHVYYTAYRTEQVIKADPNLLANTSTSLNNW